MRKALRDTEICRVGHRCSLASGHRPCVVCVCVGAWCWRRTRFPRVACACRCRPPPVSMCPGGERLKQVEARALLSGLQLPAALAQGAGLLRGCVRQRACSWPGGGPL